MIPLDLFSRVAQLLCLSAAAACGALQGCAINPVTGDRDFVLMSENEEISLGQRYHEQVIKQMPVYDDTELGRYVSEVGQRVASASHRPQLNFHFTVLDSTQVNAFALPGGYIYITRGLLAYLGSEAELAAVLGHEVGHVTARHSVRQHSASTAAGVAGVILEATTGVSGSQDLFNVFGKAILSGYGREHELESDRLGAQYLARTGYDPQAMLNVIRVLKNQELFEAERAREEGREARAYHGVFATHPDNDRRLQEVIGEAGKLEAGGAARTGKDEFLQRIDGLAFGNREADGIIVGNRFLHKPLDFGLTFPDGWRIENNPDYLLAVAPDGAALLKVQAGALTAELPPEQYLRDKGLRELEDGAPLQVDGHTAFTARAPVATNLGRRTGRFTVLYTDKHAFLFSGIARDRQRLDMFDNAFLGVAQSYRRLDPAERERARGQRLHITRTGPGTRFADLARNSPVENHPEPVLRLLNNMYPEGEPLPGQLLKLVR